MRFRNTFTLLTENFKNVSKVLLYKIVVSLVCTALYALLILPQLNAIFNSQQFETLIENVRLLFGEFLLGGDGEALRETIATESLPAFGALIVTMLGSIIGRTILCILAHIAFVRLCIKELFILAVKLKLKIRRLVYLVKSYLAKLSGDF